MTPRRLRWAPAAVLGTAAMFTVGIDTQRSLSLRAGLDVSVPATLVDLAGENQEISEAELRVAGVSNYLLRNYRPARQPAAGSGEVPWIQVYVGYYERQTQGRTIHSPKNCLPGSGWEPLASRTEVIQTASGPVTVNRYLLKNKSDQALVLYWYQGRGRVEANEYVVKWDLLRDAALRRRTEEALVRVVVPITGTEAQASAIAIRAAGVLVPAIRLALPS
jgi:EpsI family protein